MIERCLDVAVPEMFPKTETNRQIKDDVDIGAGLTARLNHGWAELHQLAGVLIQVEADAEPLAFPGTSDWEEDIGVSRGRG
jgi:hypothetical protein